MRKQPLFLLLTASSLLLAGCFNDDNDNNNVAPTVSAGIDQTVAARSTVNLPATCVLPPPEKHALVAVRLIKSRSLH